MKDISDEELLKFISENKDRLIQYMKAEGINLVDVTRKNVKEGVSKVNEAATNIKDDLEPEIETIRNNTKEFINAFTNEDVQRHLIRSGMEFMLAIGTILDAIPKPEFVSKVCEKASDLRSNINKEYCANNEDCPKKAEKLKKIAID